MAAENLPAGHDIRWVLGTAGSSESCDDVCAANLNSCGEERDEPCSEEPSCVVENLEASWLDPGCGILAAARAEAGGPAWSGCAQCSPADYCPSSSCMFCAPGVSYCAAIPATSTQTKR